MYVDRLDVTDFRNYERESLQLTAGTTLFVGNNGQGKTNLVEAIYLLSAFHSHRVSNLAPVVRSGRDQAIVRAEVRAKAQLLRLAMRISSQGANEIQVAGQKSSAIQAQGLFLTTMFAPEDLVIVRGDPAARRDFLDDVLSTLSVRFRRNKNDYDRVLRQRNALLKSARGKSNIDMSTLDLWTAQLVDLGALITSDRAQLLVRLLPEIAKHYAHLVAGKAALDAKYVIKVDEDRALPPAELTDPEAIRTYLRQAAEVRAGAELQRGTSLIGPQRDDVQWLLDGLLVRHHASHGESWSYALALKLAVAETLRNSSNRGDPVLILDDVFAELDASRRAALAESIADFEQVLITCATPEDLPGVTGRQVQIQHGTIVK